MSGEAEEPVQARGEGQVRGQEGEWEDVVGDLCGGLRERSAASQGRVERPLPVSGERGLRTVQPVSALVGVDGVDQPLDAAEVPLSQQLGERPVLLVDLAVRRLLSEDQTAGGTGAGERGEQEEGERRQVQTSDDSEHTAATTQTRRRANELHSRSRQGGERDEAQRGRGWKGE